MRRRLTIVFAALSLAAVALTALGVLLALRFPAEVIALRRVIIVCAAVFFLTAAAGAWLITRLVRPIDPDGDERPDYPELAPLYQRLDEQKSLLRERRGALEDRQNKLNVITENMTEGLLLMDAAGVIILMNKSAASLLGVSAESAVGRHIFAANQDNLLLAAVHMAMSGARDREQVSLGGRRYSAIANPVLVDGAARGVVLMLIDVTERAESEDMRREFSANVSHELKTPITTISGYAEMLAGGMVRAEDVPSLSRKIYSEARRLIALIDDVIRLSNLDEGGPDARLEEVELLSMASAVCERLEEKARDCGVSVELSGEGTPVLGDGLIIDEMIGNLVDNAIKYNRPGGQVWVSVERREGIPVLTVEDNGIGIAPEHMDRIFERFYRVDKSRSKDTGGTGLGLSIVKHGAAFLRAGIEAESVLNKGTKISIIFDGKGGN